jgi:hypothetical protein
MAFVTRDNNGIPVPVFRTGTTQVFTVTNSSVASTAFAASTTHVRVACSLGHGHIQFGAAPTASVTTSLMMPNNYAEIFAVASGDKIAVIKDSGVTSCTISVTELL